MIKTQDKELAEIERALRERLDNLPTHVREQDDYSFWHGIILGWLLAAVMAGLIYMTYAAGVFQ